MPFAFGSPRLTKYGGLPELLIKLTQLPDGAPMTIVRQSPFVRTIFTACGISGKTCFVIESSKASSSSSVANRSVLRQDTSAITNMILCDRRTTKISRLPRLTFQCVRSPSATRLHLFVRRYLVLSNEAFDSSGSHNHSTTASTPGFGSTPQ
jgi:hypothetical protein